MSLIDTLIASGHAELVQHLQSLKPADPIQEMVLQVVSDALEKHGLDGLALVASAIEKALAGRPVDLDFTDARTSHALLYVLQRAEADEKNAVASFVLQVTAAVGPIFAALLRGIR